MDDEKGVLRVANRQLLPMQCRIGQQKIYLKRTWKDFGMKQQARVEILKKLIEADQDLDSVNAEHFQVKQEVASLVAEQAAEHA